MTPTPTPSASGRRSSGKSGVAEIGGSRKTFFRSRERLPYRGKPPPSKPQFSYRNCNCTIKRRVAAGTPAGATRSVAVRRSRRSRPCQELRKNVFRGFPDTTLRHDMSTTRPRTNERGSDRA